MKRIAQVIGIFILVILVLLVGLPLIINANDFRPRLQSALGEALGRDVKIGNLKLAILSGGITADDLAIADDASFSQTPFVHAKSLKIAVDLAPFIFSRKLNVTGITIDQPEIDLLQTPSGEWNFSKLGSKDAAPQGKTPAAPPADSKPMDLSVKLVQVTNGRLTIGKIRGHEKPLVLDKVNIELRDFAPASQMPFTLSTNLPGNGTVKIDGTAGPIPADVVLMPIQVTLKASNIDLATSGVVDPSLGYAGIVTVDGSATSDGKTVHIAGDVKGDKLKLVKGGSPSKKTVELNFAITHDLKAHSGSLTRGDIHVGGASAKLTGTYAAQADTTTVTADLNGPEMPILELEGVLPALNIVLPAGATLEGGTATARAHLAGPTDHLTATGLLALNGTRLVGFDLGTKMSTIEKLAGISHGPNTEIDTLSTNFRASADGGASLEDMKLVVPSIGQLTGSGTVSAANALDFKMTVAVHGGGVLTALGNATIPFVVRGTAENPQFEPDMKALATQEVQQLGGNVGKAAGGLIKGLLGKKKGQ